MFKILQRVINVFYNSTLGAFNTFKINNIIDNILNLFKLFPKDTGSEGVLNDKNSRFIVRMKRDQKTPKKQLIDLPYDCLGEIFHFYLEDEKDFFLIFLLSKELSNLVCYFTDYVVFNLYSLPLKETSQSDVNERIFKSVKILDMFHITYLEHFSYVGKFVESLKIFKNIKKIVFGRDLIEGITPKALGKYAEIRCDRYFYILVTAVILKSFSTTCLESFSIGNKAGGLKKHITSAGLVYLPPSLTELNISSCTNVKDFSFLSSLLKLKILDVIGTGITNKDLVYFPKSLLSVDVSCCKNISCDGFKFFQDYVFKKLYARFLKISNICLSFLPKTLTELNISSCLNISNEGIKHLTKTNIKKLSIARCKKITKEGFSYLPLSIEQLNSSEITTDECLKEISKFKIKKLFCKNSNLITNEGLGFLPCSVCILDFFGCNNLSNLDYLKNYDSIEDVSFYGCEKLNDFGIINLEEFRNLRKLNLSYCNITNIGLMLLPDNLKDLSISVISNLKFLLKLKNLKRLQIHNIFTNENLELIPQTISHLQISHNSKLTDDGLKKLCCLENLTHLELHACRSITDEGVFYIVKKSGSLRSLEFSWCDKVKCTKEQIRKISRCQIKIRCNEIFKNLKSKNASAEIYRIPLLLD